MKTLIDCLAADVGRLRNRVKGDEYADLLLARIASAVEALDAALQPTAAEIYRENFITCLDDELALECALEDVDARESDVRRLLGIPDARLPSLERIRQMVEEMATA